VSIVAGIRKNGYKAKLRPSGHDISNKFSKNNGASIPPNLIAIANTESNSSYLTKCNEKGIKPHPARFPVDLPEFFIRMLSDKGDFVLDPFGGSCVTGEAAERLQRKWVCVDSVTEYLEGGKLRFPVKQMERKVPTYRLSHPAALWNGVDDEEPLPFDGGKQRPEKSQEKE
jgi:site-specific DNA-methyltransferase (cytosine-N4-specific)